MLLQTQRHLEGFVAHRAFVRLLAVHVQDVIGQRLAIRRPLVAIRADVFGVIVPAHMRSQRILAFQPLPADGALHARLIDVRLTV